MNTVAAARLKVADETWIATALLHREHPEAEDFTVQEIVDRAKKENITGTLRPGIYVHANSHCVANRLPSPGTYRMLFETGSGRRRLFRVGDPADPKRQGKTHPRGQDIPEQYRYLVTWYVEEYAPATKEEWLSGIYEMIGAGKELWRGEDPDAYVRRLREGWE
jgi:hypothetical protein